MSSLNIEDPGAFNITKSDIYIDNDLHSQIERIVDEKLNKILFQKNLMNETDEATRAKVQLLFGQDVLVISKGD